MPTTYSDQFFLMDPANPPPPGTLLTVSVQTLTDQDDDGDIDRFNGDAINGVDIVNSWPGDTVTINVDGVNITYTGITFYLPGGVRVFTPTDGQVLQEGTLVSTTWVNSQGPLNVGDLGPPCFVEGTLIETSNGPVPVEALQIGDLVVTGDNGLQPIRWIGRRMMTEEELRADARLRPVVIRADALAPGVPSADLMVSQQHRVLVRSKIAERMFASREVLVAAKHLCDLDGIELVENSKDFAYFHILFERHEIVRSNGAETESLYVGPVAIRSTDRDAVIEVLTLFPELMERSDPTRPVRTFVAGRLGRKLASRHRQNGKPMLMDAFSPDSPIGRQRLS